MVEQDHALKVQREYTLNLALIYIRQSTQYGVEHNIVGGRWQREEVDALVLRLEWSRDKIIIVDCDQAVSGSVAPVQIMLSLSACQNLEQQTRLEQLQFETHLKRANAAVRRAKERLLFIDYTNGSAFNCAHEDLKESGDEFGRLKRDQIDRNKNQVQTLGPKNLGWWDVGARPSSHLGRFYHQLHNQRN